MAKVEIIITQTAHGSSAAGEAKRGLDPYSVGSEPIVFTNSVEGNKNVTKWEWVLLERPPSSTAQLSGSDTREASLQADVYGRYVVSLRVNDLGDGTPGYSVTVAGVSYSDSGGTDIGDWDLPAFNEGVYANWTDKYGSGNPYGAQREMYRIVSDVRTRYLGAMSVQGSIIRFPFSTTAWTVQKTSNTTPTIANYVDFAMSDYIYRTIKFGVVLYNYSPVGGRVAWAKLRNLTNGFDITGSLVSTDVGPITVLSSALTVGTSGGTLRLALTRYSVLIYVAGGTSGECHLYDAFLDLDA
jgi:hypothetical protein